MSRAKKTSKTQDAVAETANKSTAVETAKPAVVEKKTAVSKTATKADKKLGAAKKSTAKTTKKSGTAAKSTVKKIAEKKPVTKPVVSAASKNSAVKKTAKGKTDEVVFQSGDKDYTLAEITQLCKDAYRGGTRKQIKSIKVYVKAEKNKLRAYYVVNDSINGSVDL